MAGFFGGMGGAMGSMAKRFVGSNPQQQQQPGMMGSGIAPTQQFGAIQGFQNPGMGGGNQLGQMNGLLQSGEAFGQPQIGAPGSGMGMASMMPTNIADLINKFTQQQGDNRLRPFERGFGGSPIMGGMGRMSF